jgi:hypothetical protein
MNELYARAASERSVMGVACRNSVNARASPAFQWTNAHAAFVASPAAARLAYRAIVLARDGGKSAFDAIAASAGGVPASLRMHAG